MRPGYFETMRTPLVAGRTFTEADNDPKRNVVVVDTVLAAKAFPNESAVGKRILIRIRTPEPEWVEIIGVVAAPAGHLARRSGTRAGLFRRRLPRVWGANRWAVRTGGDPAQLAGAVRAAVAEVNPQFLVMELRPMDALVLQAQASTRFSLLLIGVFAVMAALLVALDSTASCRRSCASAPRKSACAWRLVRRPARFFAWWSATACG